MTVAKVECVGDGKRSEIGKLFQRTGACILKDLFVVLRLEETVGRNRVIASADLVRVED